MGGTEVSISGSDVIATSPEGKCAKMPVQKFMEAFRQGGGNGRSILLPRGVIHEAKCGKALIVVHETEPQTRTFRWIANDSPAPFGPKATYRDVTIALPYVVLFAAFTETRGRGMQLSGRNEVFFRTQPLCSMDDELCYPALLNVSRFDKIDDPESGRNLCWICTQHLNYDAFSSEEDLSRRISKSIDGLYRHLMEGAYNLSSEHNEHSSWFTETVRQNVDERISSIERWQAESAKDRWFVLDVPFLKTGYTVQGMIDRLFGILEARSKTFRTADDVARFVFNQSSTSRQK